eukprot:TRINITY_DN1910_c0_g3_i1.p1 TRINITY_DN1910_c0_g3~~TRINITY_DN1910_c0_g3_i1.p1  ORF type:complete len:193 (-),score=45.41 TRINITY_DN1910_c0_g3_i1:56-595(-)
MKSILVIAIIIALINCATARTRTFPADSLATYSHPLAGAAGCSKETNDVQVRGIATLNLNGPATGYARFSAYQAQAAFAYGVTLTCNLITPLTAPTQFQLSNVAHPDWTSSSSCNDQPASNAPFATVDIDAGQVEFTEDITDNYQSWTSSAKYGLSFSATTKTIDTQFTGCYLTLYYSF